MKKYFLGFFLYALFFALRCNADGVTLYNLSPVIVRGSATIDVAYRVDVQPTFGGGSKSINLSVVSGPASVVSGQSTTFSGGATNYIGGARVLLNGVDGVVVLRLAVGSYQANRFTTVPASYYDVSFSVQRVNGGILDILSVSGSNGLGPNGGYGASLTASFPPQNVIYYIRRPGGLGETAPGASIGYDGGSGVAGFGDAGLLIAAGGGGGTANSNSKAGDAGGANKESPTNISGGLFWSGQNGLSGGHGGIGGSESSIISGYGGGDNPSRGKESGRGGGGGGGFTGGQAGAGWYLTGQSTSGGGGSSFLSYAGSLISIDRNNNGPGNSTEIIYNTPPILQSFTITRPSGQAAVNGVYVGETLTLSGRITDSDGNLDKSSFWWDRGIGAWHNNPGMTWDGAPDATGWSNFPSYTAGNTGDRTITANWTPWTTGTFGFHHAGGDAAGAWVNNNGVAAYITVPVKANPAISIQLLDASRNVLPSNSVAYGDSFYVRVNGNSNNAGTNIGTYYSRVKYGSVELYQELAGDAPTGYRDFGPYTATSGAATWDVWAHVRNADDGGWLTGNERGWASAGSPDLTVSTRPLTITRAGSKTYDGSTSPTGANASITVGSLAAGDSISYTYAATSSANAGTYPITVTPTVRNASNQDVTANYVFTYNGNYIINAATLTATADAKTMTYGAAVPPLTISYSGWVGGQTAATAAGFVAPTVSTTATSTSNAGTYPITVSGGSATNYTFTRVNGTLTINAQAITITLSGTDFEWSGSPQSVSVVTSPAGIPVTVTYSGSTTAPTNAGTYTVLAVPTDSLNYVGSASSTLRIRARLTVGYAQASGGLAAASLADVSNPTAGSSSGGGLYLPGEVAAISATAPLPFWYFGGWTFTTATGGATLNSAATNLSNGVVIGTRSLNVQANYTRETFQLTVQPSPNLAGGATSPQGTITVNAGTTYTLTASDTSGSSNWYFAGWQVGSGTVNLQSVPPTDPNPTPPAYVIAGSDATVNGIYAAKAPASITMVSPAAAGTVTLTTTTYGLSAIANSGATVSFSLISTVPSGIVSLSGSTITPSTPPQTGRVNFQASVPTTRTFLSGTLNTFYNIADGGTGFMFSEEAPVSMAIGKSSSGSAPTPAPAMSSNMMAPPPPNDFSGQQYLEAATANEQLVQAAGIPSRSLENFNPFTILTEISGRTVDGVALKTKLAEWLKDNGRKTGSQTQAENLAALKIAASAANTTLSSTGETVNGNTSNTGTPSAGSTPIYGSISTPPTLSDVASGKTVYTKDGGQYKADWNPSTQAVYWKKL